MVISASILNAQHEIPANSNTWYSIVHYENKEKENNKKCGIKERTIESTSRTLNGRKYSYDTEGRLVSYKYGRAKEIRAGYASGEQKEFVSFHKQGKLIELDSFVWNGKNLNACYILDKNRKVFKRQLYKYDSTFVTEYTFEKQSRGKYMELERYVYEYYPDYTYKKITRYKKGKPKKHIMFDCNPLGEDHKIKKDSAFNCIKYDTDSLGNKIKVTITNLKGASLKKVEYFNNNDQRIAEKTYDLKKNGGLMWAYFYDTGDPIYYTKFISYKRGREFYKIENKYDKNSKCTESVRWSKGRIRQTYKNSFNEKGLLAKAEMYNRKNRKKSEVRYIYEYY